MYIIYAPGGLGYSLVKNTEDNLSTHVWHHGTYGLQRARRFRSRQQAQAVINSGFRDAGGHPARVMEVRMRRAYCAVTRASQAEYWLCPGISPYESTLRWRKRAGAQHEAKRFTTSQSARQAAQGTRLPEASRGIEVVLATEVILLS